MKPAATNRINKKSFPIHCAIDSSCKDQSKACYVYSTKYSNCISFSSTRISTSIPLSILWNFIHWIGKNSIEILRQTPSKMPFRHNLQYIIGFTEFGTYVVYMCYQCWTFDKNVNCPLWYIMYMYGGLLWKFAKTSLMRLEEKPSCTAR